MVALPKHFIDAHHHFLDTRNNAFQTFLSQLVPSETYLPTDYNTDVVVPLQQAGVTLLSSVHVECLPDDPIAEVRWLEASVDNVEGSTVEAIVASCDLTQPTIEDDLRALKSTSPKKVRGVRWILDCVGPYEPNSPTHPATLRHDGIDYLRGGTGGSIVPEFERGFAALAQHDLSFDLQCAPAQLVAAADLIARNPGVRVALDHLGKPRTILGADDSVDNMNVMPDEKEMKVWRTGMQALAALPNVYVKLSMLGYAVPGWVRTDERKQVMKSLICEIVDLFGPQRCMAATNWWKSAAMSDSDGLSDAGPDPVQLLQSMADFLEDYSEEDREFIFFKTAQIFYRVDAP